MPRYGERPGYEERVEEGSDLVFEILGQHIDPKTSQFMPGHEARIEVARQALSALGLPSDEIEDSIAIGETSVRDHVQQLQQLEARDQAELWGQLHG